MLDSKGNNVGGNWDIAHLSLARPGSAGGNRSVVCILDPVG